MPLEGLARFVGLLEKHNELIRIKCPVSPSLQIAEITDRVSKQEAGGKALLFENTGTAFPLLINSLGSEKRICLALGVKQLDDIGKEIEKLFKDITSPKDGFIEKLKLLPELQKVSSWMPKITNKKAPCHEIIDREPDITKFPVLKCWPFDGGNFITLPLVHTKHPVSTIRNVGMYRMQVTGKTTTGMHWHRHKTGARHFEEYKKLGKIMPVAVSLGGDPVYTYSATAPLPDNFDEYIFAGFLRKKQVPLVRCITQDMEVPADSDIVIEGYIDPGEDFISEGPFGDHTGFYSLPGLYPVFHITCITYRKDAIFPATIVGIPPQEDAWLAKATERIFLEPLKMTLLPEIIDWDLPVAGVAHNLAIVKINKSYPGHAAKIINALWGAGQMMFNKIMIATDGDTLIHDYKSLAKKISRTLNPATDILFGKGASDVLDHASARFTVGGKMAFDCTAKYEEEIAKPPSYPPVEMININDVKKYAPEITGINNTFVQEEISLMVLSLHKCRINQVNETTGALFATGLFNPVKVVVWVDEWVDISDPFVVAWYCCSNIDPERDCTIIKHDGSGTSHLVIDGTRKTKSLDNFDRDCPNVIVSDNETILWVDANWEKFGISETIPSPSRKFMNYNTNLGSMADPPC